MSAAPARPAPPQVVLEVVRTRRLGEHMVRVTLVGPGFEQFQPKDVNGTYVSTGVAGYETPTGYFSVFSKLRYDDMTSGLAVPPGEYYYVEGKYTFAPRFFMATRFERNDYAYIQPQDDGAWIATPTCRPW